MHLATDYIHPTPGRGIGRVRVFLPEDPERDLFVVVCTELLSNRGESVTNAAERIAGSVIDALVLPVPVVWIEHYPPETTDGRAETFDLVVFGHYEVREIVRAVEEGPMKEIGPPHWQRLDRGSVEVLVGRPTACAVASERGRVETERGGLAASGAQLGEQPAQQGALLFCQRQCPRDLGGYTFGSLP